MKKEDLLEFLKMLDFKRIGASDIEIVSNRFNFSELPESIREYLDYYFHYIDLIK